MNVVPNNIMNIWFPKKKGIALGWATMGLPLCTATLILVLNRIGSLSGAYGFMAALCIAAALLAVFFVRDTPEEAGETPDNEPIDQEYTKMISQRQREAAKRLTMAVLLKNKNTWLIGFGNLIPSMIGSCFGRFGFIEANRIIAPLQSVRYFGFVIISVVGTQHMVLSYWIFLMLTAIGTVMMFLIRIPDYDSETGDPIGIYL